MKYMINAHDTWVWDLGVKAAENFKTANGCWPCESPRIQDVVTDTEAAVKAHLVEAGVHPDHLARAFAVRTYAFLEAGRA